MERFLDRSKRKSGGRKKTAVQKETRTVFEACERALRDSIFGARGPDSILSVVVAPKRENGMLESLISHSVYKVPVCGQAQSRNSENPNCFDTCEGLFATSIPKV